MQFFKNFFTDSKDRPELKAVAGLLFIAAGLVVLFVRWDYAGALAVAGLGVSLLFGKTVEDVKLDADKGA